MDERVYGNTMASKYIKRKVTKIGNSHGVTLPSKVMEHLDIGPGDEVRFTISKEGRIMLDKHRETSGPNDGNDGFRLLMDNYEESFRIMRKRQDP
ncbi:MULTISPECIES: AbrB/MazE/SpoVT family DNA-binding domain-containing protein [Bhargavaea]|uniref:AbrB/MazE/SpoVT family DNA-binding domain-containing protein n=1 Tax=Bhargavaea changchunensis TaxID=2134037 RepID=A0ABW2NDI3_9BACL|nr:AbrB/MazE/SpoVT family DNA-binding domain-containing protein [Bhargavaea sp. CC-171006]